jgi:hypothetical protein
MEFRTLGASIGGNTNRGFSIFAAQRITALFDLESERKNAFKDVHQGII